MAPPFWYDPNVTIYYLPGDDGLGEQLSRGGGGDVESGHPNGLAEFWGEQWTVWIQHHQQGQYSDCGGGQHQFGERALGTLALLTLTNIDDAPPLYFSDPFWSNYPSRFYRIAFPGQYPTITESPSVIITNAGFGIGNNQFGFTITGPANISVTVQATTNLPGGIMDKPAIFHPDERLHLFHRPWMDQLSRQVLSNGISVIPIKSSQALQGRAEKICSK